MDGITGKRRGRPRKDLVVSKNAGQGAAATSINVRHGQAGRIGNGPQADAGGAGKVSWNEFVALIQSHRSWENSVAAAFWPDAPEKLIKTECGWVNVHPGRPAYQLNNGDLIEIQ